MSIHNPFSSDFLRSRGDDHLRPQGPLSYVAGTSDDPLKYMTISQLLDRACARHGGRTAAIFAENKLSLSWYDLRERSNDVAAGLLALGIGRGDRVGIWAPNRAEWLYTQFGTARIGAILVNINPAYRSSELEYALNKVGCKALIMARRHRSSDYVEMLRTVVPEVDREANLLQAAKLPKLKHVVVLDDGPHPRGARLFSQLLSLGRSGPSRPAGWTFRRTRSGRRHQYPVHQRHDRVAQRGDAHPFQHRQQRTLRGEGHGALRRGSSVHSGAALSLFRHGAGRAHLHSGRRRHGLPRRGFRC